MVIFEEDEYVLLHLLEEAQHLRVFAEAITFNKLIHHTTVQYLMQYFPDAASSRISRMAYITNKSTTGIVSEYLREKPDYFKREQVIRETALMFLQYIKTLER